MVIERINDQSPLKEGDVQHSLLKSDKVIIQYSEPIYSKKDLQLINQLCVQHHRLEVRFYGHGKKGFDCSNLAFLPSVESLLLDGLEIVKNLSGLYELQNLRHLSIGVHRSLPIDFLEQSSLYELESLSIGDSQKPTIDLIHLEKYSRLQSLGIASHSNGLSTIGKIRSLKSLSLAGINKSVSLDFVGNINSLEDLTLLLGGRISLEDASHPKLKKLKFSRLLGLEGFEPKWFQSLEDLQIDNQPRITGITFTSDSNNLKHVRLSDCKGLGMMSGLSHLKSLNELSIHRSALHFGDVIRGGLPPSLKKFQFSTGRVSQDRKILIEIENLELSK